MDRARNHAGIEKVRVCDAVAKWLLDREIRVGFGIIGGGNISLWDAIARGQGTRLIPTHHEQAAAMAGAYYARTTGGIGLALVTTGAGSSNALTGVLAAYMDGTPLLVISGNEASRYMGADTRVWGVQGYDSTGVAAKFTKISKRCVSPSRIVNTLEWLADLALAAPQGPCWLDIPKDIQNATV